MVVTNLTPVPVAGRPPVIISMVINKMQTPGLTPDKTIWNVTFTYSDNSKSTMGLITDHVQYWIDNLDSQNITDNTGANQFPPEATFVTVSSKVVSSSILAPTQTQVSQAASAVGAGSTNAEKQTGKSVTVNVSDNTKVTSS